MASTQEALRQVLRPPVVTRSLWVAAIVGTVLNAINQGPELLAGRPIVTWKLALTYLVPFLVASYGAWSALRTR